MAVVRTAHVENPGAVAVSPLAGEFLHFTITAGGVVPIFSFASHIKGTLYEAPDFLDHPKTTYEWEHLKNPSDVQQLELLNVGLAFLSNADYRYTVELRGRDAPATTVLDVTYIGAPTDTTSESFTVVIR